LPRKAPDVVKTIPAAPLSETDIRHDPAGDLHEAVGPVPWHLENSGPPDQAAGAYLKVFACDRSRNGVQSNTFPASRVSHSGDLSGEGIYADYVS
jgi:hypothetical protein